MSLPAEITVTELKRMRDEGEDFTLLDVREDDELEIARLPFAKHVPMATVPDHLDELTKDGDIVVMCHGGTRSGRVAKYLREQGYKSVANLRGGIDAWSEEIDSSIPTY
jgi:adenylyltransferase/sulfurtransferase